VINHGDGEVELPVVGRDLMSGADVSSLIVAAGAVRVVRI
jgi:hypothetical protein